MISLHKRSNGGFLTTIKAVADRSWVVNNKGKCTLLMSLEDEKTVREYMMTRNLVCISHPKLPLWGGVIETDQDWNDRGVVQFTAWSAESLLMSRTPLDGPVSAATPGSLFKTLISYANRGEDMLIRPGDIYQGGEKAEVTLDGTSLFDVVRDLAIQHDMEFDIRPVLDATNSLTFEANWYRRMGQKEETILSEGHNVKRPSRPLRVTRRVVNQLTGFGEGSTESRPKITLKDDASIERFGLMEGTEDFDGVTDATVLKASVLKRLRVLRNPKYIVGAVVLDVEDTFYSVRLGNTLPFRSASYGFQNMTGIGMQTNIRVMSMRYLERPNELETKNQTEELAYE